MLMRLKRRLNPRCVLVVVLLVISFLLIVSLSKQIDPRALNHIAFNSSGMSRHMEDTTLTYKDDVNEVQKTCADTSIEELEKFFGEVKTDMNIWTFKERIKCNKHDIGNQFASKARRKLSVKCSNGSAHVSYSETFNSSDVLTFQYGDPCFGIYVNKCCGMDHRIPKVAHYVWYMRGTWTFVPFLSILSIIRFVKPCAIVFHGEIPSGPYWDAVTFFYPNIIHLKRERPTSIFGIEIKQKTHSSDIMRIEALTEYGGIYMDTDTILVKPLEKLMDYPFVLSNQSTGVFGSAFIMSERNSSFLQLWMNEYKIDYHPERYIYNAMISTKNLAQNESNKHLIHIEYGTVSRPIRMTGHRIYLQEYATHDWSYIYGIHSFIRIYREVVNETTIRNMNNTFGSVCRHVFYGDKELCL